jgi:hypothetical protein
VFRWPVELTALSLGSIGAPRDAVLEVTPRGAAFTLSALSHVGHPAHLAVIDAYLKGQVRVTATTGIGEDSRQVASSLAVPLLAAHELGVERLTLADLVLLPHEEHPALRADVSADGHPTFGADSPKLLFQAVDRWVWVRGAEQFEAAGCLGTRQVGLGDAWVHAVAALPAVESGGMNGCSTHWPIPILAEVRAPSADDVPAGPAQVARLRVESLARWAGASLSGEQASSLAPAAVSRSLAVSLTPEPDGYQTLCLLPPADADPAAVFELMRDLAWETIEGLIGRQLPERRTEPIALRLVAADGRATTLDIGASVVIGRNQTVFAAWVGSDGRVMVRLLPPAGMFGR